MKFIYKIKAGFAPNSTFTVRAVDVNNFKIAAAAAEQVTGMPQENVP